MGNISNKNQLTQRYNRRYITSSSNDTSKDNVSVSGKINWDYIHEECSRPLKSRWAVKATKVAKANNYDIERESMRLFNLQCRYNTCDFNEIELRRQQRIVAREKAIQERKDEVARRNKIARMKSAQACAVKQAKKNTLSEAIGFHLHSNIIKLACG